MRKINFLIGALLIVFQAFGQSDKPVISVLEFTETSGSTEQKNVVQVQEMVVEELVNTKRFAVVKGEHELATHHIIGNILAFELTEKTNEAGETFYNTKIQLNLQVKETEVGAITVSETLEGKNTSSWAKNSGKVLNTLGFNEGSTAKYTTSLLGAKTEAEAINGALKNMKKSISAFVTQHFPYTTEIVEVTKVKGKAAAMVLILTGTDSGLSKGSILIVKEIIKKTIAGKTYIRKKEVGKLKVKTFEGDFAVCSVKKGGDLIASKLKNAAKLKVTTVK